MQLSLSGFISVCAAGQLKTLTDSSAFFPVTFLVCDVYLQPPGGQVPNGHSQRQEAQQDHASLPTLFPWPHPHPSSSETERKQDSKTNK